MSKSYDLGRRASKLELESTEQKLLFHLAEVQRRFESANDDLVRQAAEVTRRVEHTVSSVKVGHHVNSLGELQSSGPRFDMLCAVRQERVERVVELVHLANSIGVVVGDNEVLS